MIKTSEIEEVIRTISLIYKTSNENLKLLVERFVINLDYFPSEIYYFEDEDSFIIAYKWENIELFFTLKLDNIIASLFFKSTYIKDSLFRLSKDNLQNFTEQINLLFNLINFLEEGNKNIE